MFMMLLPIQSDLTMLDALTIAGARANLELCLDAADANSSPSGTATWNDVSGNARDYQKVGTITFTGTVGKKDESTYWSFGLNSHWDAISATSWDDNFHKDNGKYSVLCYAMFDAANAGTLQGLYGNNVVAGTSGIAGLMSDTDRPQIFLTVTANDSFSQSNAMVAGNVSYHFVSWDEAADSLHWISSNNSAEASTSVPAATNVVNPSNDFTVGATRDSGSGRNYIGNGARMYAIAALSQALTFSQLHAIRAILAARFPNLDL